MRGRSLREAIPASRRQMPKGVRDLFGPVARAKRELEATLTGRFRSWGYEDIVPTTLELLENQTVDLGSGLDQALFKFVDVDGRILALRGDFTNGIARIVATKLVEEPLPLRLCYTGPVFRHVRPLMGRDREFHQAGVELVGWDGSPADVEVLALAADCLQALDRQGFRINVGHAGFFRALFEDEGLEPEQLETIRDAVGNRDQDELAERVDRIGLSGRLRELLLRLPDLCGERDLLEEARALAPNESSRRALTGLASVLDTLGEMGHGPRFLCDLGEVRGLAYYSGILFEGFVPGLGFPVLSGGRYDHLLAEFGRDLPAVGFAFILDRLLLHRDGVSGGAPLPDARRAIVLPGSASIAQAHRVAALLRARGWTVVVARDPPDGSEPPPGGPVRLRGDADGWFRPEGTSGGGADPAVHPDRPGSLEVLCPATR